MSAQTYDYVVKMKLTHKTDPNRTTVHDVRVTSYNINDAIVQAFYDLGDSLGHAVLMQYNPLVMSVKPDVSEPVEIDASLLRDFMHGLGLPVGGLTKDKEEK